jgi:hypothetical protein
LISRTKNQAGGRYSEYSSVRVEMEQGEGTYKAFSVKFKGQKGAW